MPTYTTTQLQEIARPFIGAQSALRDYVGGHEKLDIYAVGLTKLDAIVRDVTDEGIVVFFYRDCELVRWERIEKLVVRRCTMYDCLGKREFPAAVEALRRAA